MKKSTRRDFITAAARVSIGTAIAVPALGSLMAAKSGEPASAADTGFDQQPLQYAYNALEPSIDAMTMEIHYSKHAAAYSKNLKEAATAENVDVKKPLEDVLKNISKYSTKMRNNGGGHYNHELFWKCLTNKTTQPSAALVAAINTNFTSLDEFKKQFGEAAKTRFGSGWAWLSVSPDKKLVISSTPNQDNPLMPVAEVKGNPLFGLDVWEHAYYLKYQNKRADYIDAFWKILNWDFVSERFAAL